MSNRHLFTSTFICRNNNSESGDSVSAELTTDELLFCVPCAAQGCHEYRKIWRQARINQQLTVKNQSGKLFNQYSIGLFAKIRGRLNHCPGWIFASKNFKIFEVLFRIWG